MDYRLLALCLETVAISITWKETFIQNLNSIVENLSLVGSDADEVKNVNCRNIENITVQVLR